MERMKKTIGVLAAVFAVLVTGFCFAAMRGMSQRIPAKAVVMTAEAAASAPATAAVDNVAPAAAVASPGTTLYQVVKGDTLPKVVSSYLDRTSYMTKAELADAIRQGHPNLPT